MRKVLDIRDLNYLYKKNQVLFDFNLTVEEASIVTILGTPNSGKTTIKNYILSLNKKNITVYKDEQIYLYEKIIKKIYSNKNEYYENLNKITKYFKLNDSTDKFVNIIGALLTNKVIVFDNDLLDLTKTQKKLLFSYAKKNKYTLINITNNIEDTIYGDRIVVIDNGKTIMEGKTLSVLNEEKILRRLGFSLPFIIDLSKQLIYYGLIKQIYTSKEELAGVLWE